MSTTRPARSMTPAGSIPGSRSSPAYGDGDSTGTSPIRRRGGGTGLLLLVGQAAVVFTAVYLGAVAYAYSYVFFTSTVVYALITGTQTTRHWSRFSARG